MWQHLTALADTQGMRRRRCFSESSRAWLGATRSKRLFSQQLRSRPTKAEAKLWSMLRRRQLHGIKFRRQHVVAGFIVDFYSPQAKVAIELDGAVHAQRLAYDETRDAILLSLGVRTLRIGNDDVMYNMNAVLVAIARVCNATHANSKRNTRARAKRTSISNSDKPTEP